MSVISISLCVWVFTSPPPNGEKGSQNVWGGQETSGYVRKRRTLTEGRGGERGGAANRFGGFSYKHISANTRKGPGLVDCATPSVDAIQLPPRRYMPSSKRAAHSVLAELKRDLATQPKQPRSSNCLSAPVRKELIARMREANRDHCSHNRRCPRRRRPSSSPVTAPPTLTSLSARPGL